MNDRRSWPHTVVDASVAALTAGADPSRAEPMAAYMKHVAPFLGVRAGPRRQLLRRAWKGLPAPSSDELGTAARQLMALDEREFHYAAYDLVGRYLDAADDDFLRDHVEVLLTTKPWWDTVDGFGSAAVGRLCRRPGSPAVVDRWSASGDIWLIRAAIQHQRGWKDDTVIPRVLDLCDQHWSNQGFFVAKAIGWALRDIARLDPPAVEAFLDQHPERNTVAVREARRGLASTSR